MPAGRSTFNKRQKEQQRQQKARDKAERRLQRKSDDEPVSAEDEMAEMRRLAEEQAALFRIGDEAGTV
jgi:hypothetical protein